MMGDDMLRASVVILVALFLVSCGTSPPPGSPAFQEGWRDGCASADYVTGKGGSLTHDVKRSTLESDYKSGWTRGLAECKETAAETY